MRHKHNQEEKERNNQQGENEKGKKRNKDIEDKLSPVQSYSYFLLGTELYV